MNIFPDYMKASGLNAEIKANIEMLSTFGKPQESFLFTNIHDFMRSQERLDMITGERYFKNTNDISNRKRMLTSRSGGKVEATTLSNQKLSHPFFRKLVRQKINYLLTKPFTISCEDAALLNLIETWCTETIRSLIKSAAKEAIIKGISWVQVYYDEKGQLGFKRIPSEEVLPFWNDADHTKLDAVLRTYYITKYEVDGSKKDVQKVEYHTLEGSWYYEVSDKGLIADPDHANPEGHFNALTTNEEGQEVVTQMLWERIPFIPLKYNEDEVSLLNLIKTMVDSYDLTVSDMANTISDIPNSIKIVKNYDGTDKQEFTENLNLFRTAFVSGDGDVKSLDSTFDTQFVEAHLNRLRKDIYEGGSGVDTQEASIGNISGVALKFRYADLDMDCSELGMECKKFFQAMCWFVQCNALSTSTLQSKEVAVVDVIFNTDIVINETEAISEVRNSLDVVSQRTALENHPWVKDIDEELAQIEADKQKAVEEQLDFMKRQSEADFNFGAGSESNSEEE